VAKAGSVALVALGILLAAAAPGDARGGGGHGHGSPGGRRGGHFEGHHHRGGHGRVFIGVGPALYAWPYWDPFWYYPPGYVYPPPPVVVEEPPVYIQQESPAPSEPQSYWYYCASAKAYYPSVQQCPEAWIPVPPRTQ
jgi:hypothetical protein